MDVALILWNADVIEWVSLVLQQERLTCCGIEPSGGEPHLEQWIASRNPRLVMLDLAPPYEESTKVFRRLLGSSPDRLFVLTCADPSLAIKAGPWVCEYLTLQKPYDPETIRLTLASMLSHLQLKCD
ncbi:MAG TPA: hypothetical protein VGK48_23915 [Terriglobia bacterium]